MAGASGVVTGMGKGWVVVFSKSSERQQPRSAKWTEGDVAGTLLGYGEDGVVMGSQATCTCTILNGLWTRTQEDLGISDYMYH